MKMPGFTAELSLDKPRQYYRSAANRAEGVEAQTAVSQLSAGGKAKCFRECILATCVPGDDFCWSNCRCECYGKPGINCHYM